MSNAIDFCKFSQCLRRIGLFSDFDITSSCSQFSLSFFIPTQNLSNSFSGVISLWLVFMRLRSWGLSIKVCMKYNPFIWGYFPIFKPREIVYVILEIPLRQLPLNNMFITMFWITFSSQKHKASRWGNPQVFLPFLIVLLFWLT